MAARGLDLPGITLAVNFDLPKTAVAYLHRAGRVGRLNPARWLANPSRAGVFGVGGRATLHPSGDADVIPGYVVSLCTSGASESAAAEPEPADPPADLQSIASQLGCTLQRAEVVNGALVVRAGNGPREQE